MGFTQLLHGIYIEEGIVGTLRAVENTFQIITLDLQTRKSFRLAQHT